MLVVTTKIILLWFCCFSSCCCLAHNVVLVLTDDQDVTLGGLSPISRIWNTFESRGVVLDNHFVNTPVCCPSRATLFTGRSFRSLRTTGPDSCMHVDVSKANNAAFAATLARAGYANAYFGKQLNVCVREPPPGYRCTTGCRWFAYGGGTDRDPGSYMNATFYDYKNNAPHETDEDHPAEGEFVGGYTTSILGNKSVEWVKNTAREPFSLVVGHRAPHIPATPAPWYENEFANLTAPRDAAYNASDLSRFHWLIAQQPPITQEQGEIIDELFRNRWRCLLSVVDATLALLDALDLSSTYVFYTSDNGYNLGQHRLPSCKLNVYDHDLRVPMGILGPGVRRGEKINFLASSHLDIKPTILSLVNMTCSDEDECEGVDLSPFILSAPYNVAPPTQVQIEYYSLGNVTRTGHLVDDTMSNTYRGERSVPPHALGDFLYAEFTAFSDWDFEHPTFFEAFNLTRDPHQLDNILFSEK